MFARATTLQGSADDVETGVQQYREALSRFRQIPGNQGAFLLIDRRAGKGIGVTLWESEQAMTDSREQADQLRQQAAEQAGGRIESVEEYEVAVWDVSS
jgi:heme-degrading monooxygenase HmoA